MPSGFNALFVILCLCVPVWLYARHALSTAVRSEDFDRRMSVWLVLTAAGQLIPSIFVYALLATPVLVWAARRDSNPQSMCMVLLFAVPPVSVPIDGIIVNHFIDLDPFRILALTVMLPALLIPATSGSTDADRPRRIILTLAWCYVLTIVAVNAPNDSITVVFRRLTIGFIDTIIPVAFFSQMRPGLLRTHDNLAMIALAASLMAIVATFERSVSWLLYVEIADRWGTPNSFAYLFRGDSLRAQASAGHSLSAGYFLAMGLCACAYLISTTQRSRRLKYLAGLLVLGLWGTFSRSPWLTAILSVLVFFALDPRGVSRLFGISVGGACVAIALSATSIGAEIASYIPFLGTRDAGSVEYRSKLLDSAIEVIARSPLTGDPLAFLKLESLRQGQGIIDIVNGYIWVALFNGMIALAFFVAMLTLPAYWLVQNWSRSKRQDKRISIQCSAQVGILVGTIFFIATAGFGQVTFALVGIAISALVSGSLAMEGLERSQSSIPSVAGFRTSSSQVVP